ncbi:YqhR family membrane protein [Cohnella ginsengisoli]|uniref:YqhR family membrane protein n=1 Tax=Cohnella ginsengisoli TaxID=425004 RepID=A0A9X4KHK9_9BACL|nr:YqhR family membrane protein [Cohnella ginsengisoli]MDG0789795.1 YqhR family membrane protein [Cohnella ginsengisoli]
MADPFIKRERLDTIAWHCVGLALFVVMSVVAAYLYWLILGKLRGPWPGLFFGAAWWVLLFFWIGPATGAVPSYKEIGLGSVFTEGALYLLWGLFYRLFVRLRIPQRVRARAEAGERRRERALRRSRARLTEG